MSAAETMYTLDPDGDSISDSAHASAAANVVLMFFRGTKINASLNRRSSVPAR